MPQQGAFLLPGGRPDASWGSRPPRRSGHRSNLHQHHYLPSDTNTNTNSPTNLKYKITMSCCKCLETYRLSCLSLPVTPNWMVVSPVLVAPIYPQRLVICHRVVLEIFIRYFLWDIYGSILVVINRIYTLQEPSFSRCWDKYWTTFIHHSFRSLSYDRSIASSKASSLQCDLVLPLCISSILPFPQGNIVANYVFFLVLPSLLALLLSFFNNTKLHV